MDEITKLRADLAAAELARDSYAKQLIQCRDAHKKQRAVLEDISTFAHCVSKAGPLNTPTLAEAWSKFDQISVKATAGLS